ncbi:MAG TPA: hypothetical protein VFB15_13935 [Candidatus Binataceae bacterium]|jgi:hypothetical protein|nr:hypothetical protein [Candidatus Binataceae bacterium]
MPGYRSATRPLAALAGAAVISLLGCVTPHPVDQQQVVSDQELAAEAAEAPPAEPIHVVTDLSRLSPSHTAALPNLPDAPASLAPSAEPSNAQINPELTGKLVANAPSSRYNPDASRPSGVSQTQLLNDKARQFATFSETLLKQTLVAAQELAPDQLQQRKLPDDLNAVILVSVLDHEGRLKEIEIDQHSGDAAVDKLLIEACKKGMWSRNPPIGAIDNDGTYRIRLEGEVHNYAFDRYGQYTYETRLGLSLL